MSGEKIDFEEAAANQDHGEQKRERSTIEFPYGDMEDAEKIAETIHKNAGDRCTIEQLAAYMGKSANSGTFRLSMSTARIFGLTENERGGSALTELGRRILDPAKQRRARMEAFLKVPLYLAIYSKYKGYMLPPPKALEREIGNLGVSSKQTNKARQAFERSAQRAGFFEHGNDRLVMPAGLDAPPETIKTEPPEADKKKGGGNGGGGRNLHPLIEGLIRALPEPETIWPIEKRAKWLQAAAHNFDLVYQTDEDEEGNIAVSTGRERPRLS